MWDWIFCLQYVKRVGPRLGHHFYKEVLNVDLAHHDELAHHDLARHDDDEADVSRRARQARQLVLRGGNVRSMQEASGSSCGVTVHSMRGASCAWCNSVNRQTYSMPINHGIIGHARRVLRCIHCLKIAAENAKQM